MQTESKVAVGNVCFITDKYERVLLLKRNRHPMKDLYTGVGGKTAFKEDIRTSCLREIKEETGLEVSKLTLKGVVKTVFEAGNSSWILFVFTAETNSSEFKECDEGTLEWVERELVGDRNLIGFIREIISIILNRDQFLEGTIFHDDQGNVINKTINIKRPLIANN